jgi:DNA mismatch endonuclease (patch repair protein)
VACATRGRAATEPGDDSEMVDTGPETNRRRGHGPAGAPAALATDDVTRARMSRQRRRDTAPELLLRRELHRRGLRYRIDAPLPGMPRRRADILFTSARVAVFVDGCFWHVCPVHATAPATNAAWWAAKLEANVARDRDTDRRLDEAGWTAVRFWEHEDMVGAATLVDELVRRPL